MKRILVVQCRTSPDWLEREEQNFRRAIADSGDVEFLSALDEHLAWDDPDEFLKGYDGVIFGGSSDFDFHGNRDENDPARVTALAILSRTEKIVNHAMQKEIPVLGVCFGHQLIAQIHGGEVECDPDQRKMGSHEVRLTKEGKKDVLFEDYPSHFIAQYWHKDSVTNLPKGSVLLATGQNCKFSVLKYGNTTYTVQFHPETERIKVDRDPKPSPEASRLIPAWIERIVATG